MAFVAALAPYLAAAGAAYQGYKTNQADNFNSQVMGQERDLSVNQANAQEGMVRRNSREMLGRQVAAIGAAGGGYGGSSEVSLDQSAVNQELDALNTRYKGTLTGYGYGVQSGIDRRKSSDDLAAGGLLAGAALLKGSGANYSFAPQTSMTQAGLTAPGGPSGLGGT